MSEQIIEEEFKGVSGAMRNSQFLAAEDIPGPVQVEIERIVSMKNVPFKNGKKEDIHALIFKGKTRRLIVKATNRGTLVDAFGTNTPDWIGKKITLFVVDGVKNPEGGKPVKGIRIKI